MNALRRLPRRPLQQRFASTSAAPPPARGRPLRTAALVAIGAGTAYTLGALFPPSVATLLSPRPAPGPPKDIFSPESLAYTASLEAKLQALPLLAELRREGGTAEEGEWYETRPYTTVPEHRRVNNLTAGSLRGPGKLALPPLLRVKKDESETVGILHVGRALCGHDGIVHGGMLATLLDESLGRTAIRNLPDQVGVTAWLKVDYRKPTHADQFIVLRTRLIEGKGRKVWVEGQIEDLDGVVLVQARSVPSLSSRVTAEADKHRNPQRHVRPASLRETPVVCRTAPDHGRARAMGGEAPRRHGCLTLTPGVDRRR